MYESDSKLRASQRRLIAFVSPSHDGARCSEEGRKTRAVEDCRLLYGQARCRRGGLKLRANSRERRFQRQLALQNFPLRYKIVISSTIFGCSTLSDSSTVFHTSTVPDRSAFQLDSFGRVEVSFHTQPSRFREEAQ